MATSEGSSITYADFDNWITAFNNLATRYSNGISAISHSQDVGTEVRASTINSVQALLTKFRSDKYLGTQRDFWPTVTNVTAGNEIRSSEITRSITRAYSNASRVKCKNEARNNKGKYDSTCPNGNNSVKCGHGRHGSGSMYNGSSMPTTNSRGNCSNGYHNSGTCQSGSNSCGTYTNGTVIDILNSSATKSN